MYQSIPNARVNLGHLSSMILPFSHEVNEWHVISSPGQLYQMFAIFYFRTAAKTMVATLWVSSVAGIVLSNDIYSMPLSLRMFRDK